MKIVITGGGSGGHFYPLMAVVDELQMISKREHLAEPEVFYFGPDPYNADVLHQYSITFRKVAAGKRRLYKSIHNFLDLFKIAFGVLQAIWQMFRVFPDVVFSKGSYVSFPVVLAARLLRIPVIIHESDAHPGRANQWAAKRAEKIGVSFPSTYEYFSEKGFAEKTALVGIPIRDEIKEPLLEGSFEYFTIHNSVPTIVVVGGSNGAQKINDSILTALPELVQKYNIIHQVGKKNFEEMERTAAFILEKSEFAHRYKPLAYYDAEGARRMAAVADVFVTRAGSTLSEIALWGVPAVVIPIDQSNGDHQRKNAYSYAREGAGVVIEESNLSPHILINQIDSILTNQETYKKMVESAKEFSQPDAAEKIARLLIGIGIKHD